MKASAMRKNAEAVIESEANAKPAKSWDEATGRTISHMNAIRTVELCDIFDSLTPDELAILKSIPVYATDVRAAVAIRDKYGISWNELRSCRDMAHSKEA